MRTSFRPLLLRGTAKDVGGGWEGIVAAGLSLSRCMHIRAVSVVEREEGSGG